MYNVTRDLPFESMTSDFMDTGIHENVEMIKVEYGKATNEFIAFYFKGESGEKLVYTQWMPGGIDPEKVEEKKINQMSRIKQICMCFIPEEKFIFQSNTFEEFAKKTIEVLGTSYIGVKVRVKVVYAGNYTSLPNYWKFRFIERMDNNGYVGDKETKSKIKILSIDKMTRPTADPIPTNTNPFAESDIAPLLRNKNTPF
jgi:hypothetical protein